MKIPEGIIFVAIAIGIIFIFILITEFIPEPKTYRKSKKYNRSKKSYPKKKVLPIKPSYKKKKLITHTEIQFGNAIKKALPEGYRIFPQICLASIIEKQSDRTFVNELFRIIDFGIFDNDYNIVLLIEINDESHHKKERIARDYKVQHLCEKANIPLIRLWTEYGINEDYIEKKISAYIK